MQKQLPAIVLACLFLTPLFLFSQPKIQLDAFATGFVRPVDIAHCGDSRLFIVEQRGLIWMLDSLGNRLLDTFLNITDRVYSTGNEQGLLGLAFPPDYAQSGVFYVNYTMKPSGDTRVARFKRVPGNPNRADPASEEILLAQPQPYSNHNGGCLKFGPDGYLYIGFGDGGNGGDPQNRAQNKATWLGKMLRIDVNSQSPGKAYGIPADNPFLNDPAFLPEIWSWGWRNPWRFSFDRLTGDLWVGDVGQSTREEIDFEPAHTGGRNYGWRCYEGTFTYDLSGCPGAAAFTGPVFDYDNNSLGCSVTGGFIYRGGKYSDLYGIYLFTDYCSGRWWTLRQKTDGTFATVQIADLANSQYSTLGEDRAGELYVAALSQGTIYKIRELCSSFQLSGTVTHATCFGTFDGLIDLDIAGGTPPYTFAWTGGQTDSLAVYLDPGTYAVQAQDGIGCIRRDTFEVEATIPVMVPEASVVSWTAPLLQPGLICTGDTVLLEASEAPTGLGYQWYKNGAEIFNATQRHFVAKQPGIYQVVYTNALCHSAKSTEIKVDQVVIFFDPSIIVIGPGTLCGGDSAVLQAAALSIALTPQWFRNSVPIPGTTEQQLVVKQPGTYSIQYSTSACVAFNSDPVTITGENVPPPPVFSVTGSTVLCGQDTLILLADAAPPGLGYQWYKNGVLLVGVTGQGLAMDIPGEYTVRYTSPVCAQTPLSQPISVTQHFAPVIVRENDSTLTISGSFAAVQWLIFNPGAQAWDSLPGATGPSVVATTDGLYAVWVLDAAGCIFQSDPVGISSTRLPAQVRAFRLSPNPTQNTVQLVLELKQSARLTIFLTDAQQRTIFLQSYQGQRLEKKIDLQALPAGTYYLTVQLEDESFVRAIVRN